MSLDIRCPTCGEDEALIGSRDGEAILVTCESCDTTWQRDLTQRCPRCGSEDVREAVQAVVEKSRGTQLSMTSLNQVWLCPDCDPELMATWLVSNRPLPPDELPTT